MSTQNHFLDSASSSDLKRFSDSNTRASKLSTFVNFPLKELDLREFSSAGSGRCQRNVPGRPRFAGAPVFADGVCLLPAERVLYNLYAVSNHSGNALGGHYTAFCRHPTLGEWHFYNDTRYCHMGTHSPPPHTHTPGVKMCYLCSATLKIHCTGNTVLRTGGGGGQGLVATTVNAKTNVRSALHQLCGPKYKREVVETEGPSCKKRRGRRRQRPALGSDKKKKKKSAGMKAQDRIPRVKMDIWYHSGGGGGWVGGGCGVTWFS